MPVLDMTMRRTMGPLSVWCAVQATLAIGCDTKDEADDGVSNQGSASQASTDPIDGESETDDEGETEDEGDEIGETETDPASEPEPEPEPELDSCADHEATRACIVPGGTDGGGNAGTQYCDEGAWGPCIEMADCELGELMDCGLCGVGGDESGSTGEEECKFADFNDECVLHEGVPRWECDFAGENCNCNTPLVLSFDGAEPQMMAAPSAAFDLDVAGACVSTDWPTSVTPWLALDRDGDGGIADGRELFGSGTRLGTGRRASNGFAALAELDDDKDGKITAADQRFGELVLWADEDGDKRGVGSELAPLSSMGVMRIDLAYDKRAVCDARGNCGVERAAFTFIGRGGAIEHGAVIDVHLACQ